MFNSGYINAIALHNISQRPQWLYHFCFLTGSAATTTSSSVIYSISRQVQVKRSLWSSIEFTAFPFELKGLVNASHENIMRTKSKHERACEVAA